MTIYSAEFKKTPLLTDIERQAMSHLYLSYFDGCTETQFLSDLNEKTEVLLLSINKQLVGFTTLQDFMYPWNDQLNRIIYSGDTIVDQAHWGQQALAFAWINRMGEFKRELPNTPLYWFVIVKGHRTYKYLPTFGKSFYPHWSIDRADLKPLADALALKKFGGDYNPDTGVVEFHSSKGHLKSEIAHPTAEEQRKPAVQFFLQRNPGFLQGHELVCVCEMERENMKPLTQRIFDKGLV